ncbi:MAG: cardiolipin synthase [Acidobacteriota bacterium]|nr:cardiolipin synthase [Acidobacteriota bacterium]
MDAGFLADGAWITYLAIGVILYALSIAAFMILENRSPHSTIAWLFTLILFPPAGLVLYAMFGRSWHAFSRKRILKKLIDGSELAGRSARLMAEQPDKLDTLAAGPVGDYARVAAMLWASARSPLTLGNELEILQDASEKYPRLMGDLEKAAHSIHLLYYEWASDPFTEQVFDLLAEKVKAGVEVRIMYDPFGSLTMLDWGYLRRMRASGIRIRPFSPLYNLHTLSYRNHRKVAIIDGEVAYSGGLNMTDKHLTGPDGFEGWRDTHARVSGEAALVLQTVFATMWHNTTGENLFEEQYFPEAKPGGGSLPIQVVSAGPDSEWKAIRHSYLAMLALARHHVYLQSPFLILDDSLAEAMKTAALAGLDVRLMIAPRGGEISPAYRAGMTYAVDMARAGVKVLLYEGAYFHSKTICVDSAICSIGSANMDIRSFAINYETNLVIYDETITRELEADFEADILKCVPFSVREYKARPMVSRFADSMARLFSPLL